jgi:amino acid adenylation domain-containing protein
MHVVDKRKNIENIYPLSPMQQGMLFHTLLAPQAGVYVPQVCLNLQGQLDIGAMQTAWQSVIANHAVLRSAFYWEQRDRPFQIVFRQVEFPWQFLDWQDTPSHEQKTKLEEFLLNDRQQGFDLKQPPLMRLTLIKLSDIQYTLIWTQHHLILDGWSSALVIQEVFQRLQSPLKVFNTRPYGDYIAWLQQQDKGAEAAYWQKQLQGFNTPTSFPSQLSSSQIIPKRERLSIKVDALQTWARLHQLTLNTVIQGAFALLLSRYCNTTDVIFGATSSGRSAIPGIESMVGLFINTLPVRVKVAPQANVIEWLQKLQAQQAEALQYEYTSLLEIQEWSELPRGTSLFDSILVFENYPVDASAVKDSQLCIANIESIEWTNFPITMLVSVGNNLSLEVKYDSSRFTSETITRLLEHFCILLEGIVKSPQLQNISMLTQQEIELISKWNQTQASYPEACIHHQFESQVECTPDNIAVVFGEQQLTYRELNQRANQLAHYLQSVGVKTETPVTICMERSIEMVVGILAILKAGGAYVPLDPDYPAQRLEYIITETQAPVVLNASFNFSHIEQQPTSNPATSVNLDNAMYIIYTSGSTGNPKGVINTHRGLSNRLFWMQQQYNIQSSERILQKTPFSFDVSVWEFFLPLLNGACLVMAKPGGHQDPNYLIEIIEREQITTLHFVPAMLGVFLENLKGNSCQSIKRVICSGEALSLSLQNRFFESLGAELHNLYGPTEAAIDVTYWQCQPDSSVVPIGRPINNIQLYILDDQMQPVPIGVPGELYIGGVGVARGYWNRPDLTAQRFIPNPVETLHVTSLLYKTGDLVRYLADGNLEYLGRLDNQVKIRGLRIELDEIAAIINQHPGVIEAIVLIHQQENSSLAAYIVPKHNQHELLDDLRSYLAGKLPNYMIPSVFVLLEEFPLLPNGKVNRKALIPRVRQKTNPVIPRNSTESIIANIWVDVLRIETIGVDDNFFELGGNSLSAIRVNARLREAFQLDLPLGSLFEKQTIAALAQYIDILLHSVQQMQFDSTSTSGRKEIEL